MPAGVTQGRQHRSVRGQGRARIHPGDRRPATARSPTPPPITTASRTTAWCMVIANSRAAERRLQAGKTLTNGFVLLVIVSGLALGGLYGMTAPGLQRHVFDLEGAELRHRAVRHGRRHLHRLAGAQPALAALARASSPACWPARVFGWLSELIAVRRIVAVSDEHLWVLSTLALSTMVQEAMGALVGHRPDAVPPRLSAGFRRRVRPEILAAAHRSRSLMAFGPGAVLSPLHARQAVHRDVRGRVRRPRPRRRDRPDALDQLRPRRRARRALRLRRAASSPSPISRWAPRSACPASSHWPSAASAAAWARVIGGVDPRAADLASPRIISARSTRRPSPSACWSSCWWCGHRACSAPRGYATYETEPSSRSCCSWPFAVSRRCCRSSPAICITCMSPP